MAAIGHRFAAPGMTLMQKLGAMSWGLVALLVLTAGLGFAMLYSAANGSLEPWAAPQMVRFSVGLFVMVALALVDIRQLQRWAYWIFGLALLLLVGGELAGRIGMGAQRWIDFRIFQLQPSEVMKIALVMALARYFHGQTSEQTRKWTSLFLPAAMILAPTVLVLRQPDLGTALLLVAGGGAVMFAAGIALRWFAIGGAVALGALPVGLVVFAIGLSLGGTTGYAINPARDLGPRIVHALLPIPGKQDSDWSYAWIPVAGPCAGAAAAALIKLVI